MEQKPIIYTYGNVWIQAVELIRLMKSYNIDCVVDCRSANLLSIGQNTPVEELKLLLKCNQIAYVPLGEHFGFFPLSIRNKRGGLVYKQVVATESFLQGVERIQHGVSKGYHICIVDNERDTYKSNRFTLIGKFMKGQYNIMHINSYGSCESQEQVEQKLVDDAVKRKERTAEAKKLGETGEELTALYLVRNGYQILDRNWNLHRGCELDIVALKDNRLHFIEVKTRTSDRYGEPQTAIDKRKMRHIAKGIQAYRHRRSMFDIKYQIDSVAILYRADNDYDLKHYLDIRTDGGACDEVIPVTVRP